MLNRDCFIGGDCLDDAGELVCGLVVGDDCGRRLPLLAGLPGEVATGELFAFSGDLDLVVFALSCDSEVVRARVASFFALSAALCFSLSRRNLGSLGLDLEASDEERSICHASPSWFA